MKGFALTDHSPSLGTPPAHFSVLLRRVPSYIDGIRVFKGIEASIMSTSGDMDIPEIAGHPYEIVIAGLHPHDYFEQSRGEAENTEAMANAMRNHPYLKMITHPYVASHPVNIDEITDVACETNTALEVNNSHLLTGKTDEDRLNRMLELAKEKGTRIAVNSDGHVYNEMGGTALAANAIRANDANTFNIVNETYESTCSFLGLSK
jgi:putative hydrolase